MKEKTIAILFCLMLVTCLTPITVNAATNVSIVSFYASPTEIIKGDQGDFYFKLSGSGSVEYSYSRIDANGVERFTSVGRGLIHEIDPTRNYHSDIWWEYLTDGTGKHQNEIFLKLYDPDDPETVIAQASTMITVDGSPPNPPEPPTVDYFRFSPSTINKGQATFVEWSTKNALYCWIDDTPGLYGPVFGVGVEGRKQFRPSKSTTYRLIVFGKGGETDAYASITVKEFVLDVDEIDEPPDADAEDEGSSDPEPVDPNPDPEDPDPEGGDWVETTPPPAPPADPAPNIPPIGPIDADPLDTVDESIGEYEITEPPGTPRTYYVPHDGTGNPVGDSGNFNTQDYMEEGFGLYFAIFAIAAIAILAFVAHSIKHNKMPKKLFKKKKK